MDRLKIERRGGLAGLTAKGEIAESDLPPADRAALDALFEARRAPSPAPGADRFRYLVTRRTAAGERTLEIPEHLVPPGIAAAVREDLG